MSKTSSRTRPSRTTRRPPSGRRSTTSDPYQPFFDHRSTIESVIEQVSLRSGLDPDDADDFRAWAHLRLVQDDCRAIRAFRGRGRARSYLRTVVQNLLKDFRNSAWGKWRTSSRARALGPTAVSLERMIRRDGWSRSEAVQALALSVEASPTELHQIAAGLPDSRRKPPIRLEEAGELLGQETADDHVLDAERHNALILLSNALHQALARLPAADRTLVEQRFLSGRTVADIARGLGVPQQPLYYRIRLSLRALRSELESLGVSTARVREVLHEAG